VAIGEAKDDGGSWVGYFFYLNDDCYMLICEPFRASMAFL
jgi:hypothetical protein